MNDYQLTAAERDEALTRAQELRRKLTARAEPTGDLREALADALDLELDSLGISGEVSCRASEYLADAVLALPAVRDALAAQEAVKRVEALAGELGSWPSSRILSPHDAANRIRAALAGDS